MKLIENIDFYYENGLMILTEEFLLKRGKCCENKCKHCPYGFNEKQNDEITDELR